MLRLQFVHKFTKAVNGFGGGKVMASQWEREGNGGMANHTHGSGCLNHCGSSLSRRMHGSCPAQGSLWVPNQDLASIRRNFSTPRSGLRRVQCTHATLNRRSSGLLCSAGESVSHS